MVERNREEMLPLGKLALVLKVHPSTVTRWCEIGRTNRRTGQEVFLRRRQKGGRFFSCLAWYDTFEEALNQE